MDGLGRRQRRRLTAVWSALKWDLYGRDAAAFFREAIQVPAPGVPGGKVPFELFDYQESTLATFEDERFVVVLKARQLGLTTLAMAYALHHLMHSPGANVLLVSKNQVTADSALELMDAMWRWLPAWYRGQAPVLEVDSAREHVWRFPDGTRSRIVSLPATKTAGAGETATLVLWDEAALAENQEDAFRTLLPTTDAGGSMIVFSTARGAHNRFAKLYREAERGESEFVTVFHPWMVSRLINPRAAVGGVDDTQYLRKKRQFADEPWRFYAEYPSSAEEAFRQSGRQRFPGLPPIGQVAEFPWRGRIVAEVDGVPRLQPDPDGPLRLRPEALDGAPLWSKPVLSMDPASGTGGDYTAMTVGWFDRSGVPQIYGYWHSNDVEPLDAARQANLLGLRFPGAFRGGALLVVEAQGGYGDTPLGELTSALQYPNLYVHTYTGHRRRRVETRFGFPMTAARRPLVVDRLATWLRYDLGDDLETVGGLHPLLRHELGAFVTRDDGKVAADVGMHDDLVMSTAIWLYVLTEDVGAGATDERTGESEPRRHVMSLPGDLYAPADRSASGRQTFARTLSTGSRL